jgi:hypothetical protein
LLNSNLYRHFTTRQWLPPLLLVLLVCFTTTPASAQNTKGDKSVNTARPTGKRLDNQGSQKKKSLFSGKSRTNAKTSGVKRKTVQSIPKRDKPDRSKKETGSVAPGSGDTPYRGGRTSSGKRITDRRPESRSINIYPRPKDQNSRSQNVSSRVASLPLPSSGKGLRKPVRKDIAYRGSSASGRPVITRKQESKPQKFYPAKGPYVQRSPSEKSIRQVAGAPLKTRRLPLSNEARKVNRIDVMIKSLTGNYIAGGRTNPYAFKVRKPKLPVGSDLSGRPLRRLNYQSPALEFVSTDTLKQSNRKPKADIRSEENKKQVRTASSTGKAWAGDITGKKLKTRSTDSRLKSGGAGAGRVLSNGAISAQGLPLEKNQKKFSRAKGMAGFTGKTSLNVKKPEMYSFKAAGINPNGGKLAFPGLTKNSIAGYSGKMKISGIDRRLSGKRNSFSGRRGNQGSVLDLNQLSGNKISGLFSYQKNLNKKFQGAQNVPVAGSFRMGSRSQKYQSVSGGKMKLSRTATQYSYAGQKNNYRMKIDPLNKRSIMGSGNLVAKTKRTTPPFISGLSQANVGGIVGKMPVRGKRNQKGMRIEFSGRLREWQPTSFTGSVGYTGSAAFVKKRSSDASPKPRKKNYGLVMSRKFQRPGKGNYQFSARRLTAAQSFQYIFSGSKNYAMRLKPLERKIFSAGRSKIKSTGNTAVGPGANFGVAKLQFKDKNFSTHPDSKMLLSAGAMGYQGSRYFVTGRSNLKSSKPIRADVGKGGRVLMNPNAGMHRFYVFGKSGAQLKQYNYNRYGLNTPVNNKGHQIYTFYRQGRMTGIPNYNRINKQVPALSKYDRARIYVNGYQTKPYRIPDMKFSRRMQLGQLKPVSKTMNPKPRDPLFVPDYRQQAIAGIYSGNIRQRPKTIPQYMAQKRMRKSPWLSIDTPERRVSLEVSRYWLPVPADVNQLMKFTPERSKSRKPVAGEKFTRKVYLDPGYSNAGLYRVNGKSEFPRVGYKDQYQTAKVPLLIAPGKGTINAAGYTDGKHRNPFRYPWITGPMSDPVAIKLRRPDERAFAVDGLQTKFRYKNLMHGPSANIAALPIRGRSVNNRNELQTSNPGKRQYNFVHSDLASRKALKVQEPNRAFIRTALMQSNIKMNKTEITGLHPDATFLRDKEQNAGGERSAKTGFKLMWAKLFKKDDYQPASLKAKLKKPRYDSREIGIWND